MNDNLMFATRIRERFPEGLTGLFAIGGTRTSHILENNRYTDQPGKIEDFSSYSQSSLQQYKNLINSFFDLGGQNLVISALSFRSFFERGTEYGDLVTQELARLIDDRILSFYQEWGVDPYFVGLDTLRDFAPQPATRQAATRLLEFQKNWPYREGNRKLIWEIASIPLYTLWRFFEEATSEQRAELREQVQRSEGLDQVQSRLYEYFCKYALGVSLPTPHFYLGTNKSGDLKLRSPLMTALTAGEYLRLYYTPYPSLFVTHETLKAILDDLAFNKRFYSNKTDYKGQFTSELAQKEYERVISLASNPASVVGYTRSVTE
jgi:hypothetical protein